MADRLPDGLGYAGMKARAVFSFRFLGVGSMRWGLDAGILAKDAMQHFRESRTVRLSRVPERFFGEVPE